MMADSLTCGAPRTRPPWGWCSPAPARGRRRTPPRSAGASPPAVARRTARRSATPSASRSRRASRSTSRPSSSRDICRFRMSLKYGESVTSRSGGSSRKPYSQARFPSSETGLYQRKVSRHSRTKRGAARDQHLPHGRIVLRELDPLEARRDAVGLVRDRQPAADLLPAVELVGLYQVAAGRRHDADVVQPDPEPILEAQGGRQSR